MNRKHPPTFMFPSHIPLSGPNTSIIIFLIGFFQACFLMRFWQELGVFDQYNILFDSDPNTRIDAISHGWVSQWKIHPVFHIIFSTPIRILAYLIDSLGFVDLNQEEIRTRIGFYIVPILYGLNLTLLYKLLRLIGLHFAEAMALVLLMMVSFSTLVFSGLPDHFMLSNLLFTSHAFLLVRACKENKPPPILPLFLIGFLLAGTTVTNIVFFMALTGLYYYFTQAEKIKYLRLALLSSALIAANYALAFLWDSLTDRNFYASYVGRFFNLDPPLLWKYIYHFPLTLSHSIAGINPGLIKNLNDSETARFSFQFSLMENAEYFAISPLFIMVILALLLLGGIQHYFQANRIGKFICFYALIIISFNWILHSLWGFEQFLYSQHWMIGLVLLFSGLFCGQWIPRKYGLLLILVLGVASLSNNIYIMHQMAGVLS